MKYKLLFLTPFATSNTEGKTFRNLLAIFMVVLGMGFSWGQILQWNTYGNAGTETSEPSVYNATGISSANLTHGSGVTATASSHRFGGNNWWKTGNTNPSTLAEAITANSYIEFTVTPTLGYSFTPTSFVFGWDRSSTGPASVALRSSADSYGANIGTVTGMAASQTNGNTINISTLTGLTSATTFRLYGYSATATAGTGGFDVASSSVNVQLNGSVASVGGPNITQTGLLNTFISSAVSSPSTEQTFTVSGSNLTNDITVSAPTGYQISTSTGGSFSPTNPITLTQSSGSVATTTIYARFNPTALVDQVGGNIAITSTGATTQNVAVSGEVTNLSAGAIAFIAFQGATLDLYRIVALNDIPNNTRIWFTDKSWDGGTLSFFSGEGNNVWTNTTGSAIAAGTVIQFDAAGGATLGTGGLNSGLGSAGEQLFAYQGTLTSPTFVAGYTSGTVITTGVTTATATYVPAGLTSGTNFVALGDITFGSSYVTVATHIRSLADMRSHIHNIANLTTGNTSTTTNGNWPTYTFNFSNDWIGANGNWNTAGNWSFATVPSSSDHITISSGSPVLDIDYTLPVGKTLTLSGTGGLTVAPGKILTIEGTADFGGKAVTFKSDASGSGMFGILTGTLTNATNVKVERYIPAKRAFRFLSPSVTTSTSIKLNWQENAGTTAGLGTHITGVDGATNGFDTTATNNPSLYTFNNTSGVWEAVTSTLTNFTAGTPYRLMVRGDRLINLSTNTPTATETVLRATGTLKTGNFSPTLNQAAEGFSFVGNPYQAPVNIKTVLDAATNMNTGVVYYWDPTLNARGGYVTRDLTNNNNNVTSNFNQYLQPGQAVFVKKANTASAASVTITESHKSVANGAAGVFRTTTPNDYGLLRVNLQANTNNQWQTIEGTLALFNNNFSWNVTPEDATKMSNLDEEVSFVQNNTSLAIACVSAPSVTSELPIQLNNLRHSNYQWQFELANYQGERPYLYDTQNNTYTEITNGTTVPFTATTAAANRFKIVFQPSALNADDFTHGLVLYPNPAKAGDSFYVQGSSAAEVTVYNVLGQHIPVQVKSQGNALQVTPMQTLSQGIYLVTVTTEGKTQHVKWIVE
jgi:hypothetical protein